jgi:hypothetical protein
VDVDVVTVVVVDAAGVTVEVVVEVPICNKLLQNEVAGAFNPERTATMRLTSLHILLGGEARFQNCSSNGVARAGALLRNRRTKRKTVGNMSSDGG